MTFVKLSNLLWQQLLPTYQKIVTHPFNVELADGSLSPERFQFYMQQDACYLISFSKALALIAGRANSSQMISQFLTFSLYALVAERELHAHFLTPSSNYDTIDPSPACVAYTQYLIATAATASLEEAIAAILPCFWIYAQVGQHIANHSKKNNPYELWIKTYSSEEFSDGTNQAISLLDEIAAHSSPKLLLRMQEAFEYSSLFEWHFWNDAYNMTLFRRAHLCRK